MKGMEPEAKLRRIVGAQLNSQKRCHFPYILEWICPNCGDEYKHDMTLEHLYYPQPDIEETIGLYCMRCEKEFEVTVIPNFTLRLKK